MCPIIISPIFQATSHKCGQPQKPVNFCCLVILSDLVLVILSKVKFSVVITLCNFWEVFWQTSGSRQAVVREKSGSFQAVVRQSLGRCHEVHRGAFFAFPFRWIYYCHSSKSTGKETGKTHLFALARGPFTLASQIITFPLPTTVILEGI